ncbi:MAG: hypothetical protein ACETVY_02930 [Candidatus Bathyarchaeia archaeon]
MDTVKDRLILGHMPLIGVSYQSSERDREYRERFRDPGAMRRVIEAAIGMGVRRFAAASPDSSTLAPLHLRVLKDTADEGYDIDIIPCIGIPMRLRGGNIDAFRRWATYLIFEEHHHPSVRQLVLDDPVLNFREGWKRKLPLSKPYDEDDFKKLAIDWMRVEDDLEHFAGLPVSQVEPGSETDFLVMAGRFDLLGELVDRIRQRGFEGVLFGVHHAGVTVPSLDDGLDGFDGYLTPLNSLGVMMLPKKASAERAVRNARKAVYAIKPLAGGRVRPKEAFRYVFGFDIEGCMIGCASVSEVEEDFNAAIESQMAYAQDFRGR